MKALKACAAAEAPEWHVRASRLVVGLWEVWFDGEVASSSHNVNRLWEAVKFHAERRCGRAYLHYRNRDAVRVEVDFSKEEPATEEVKQCRLARY